MFAILLLIFDEHPYLQNFICPIWKVEELFSKPWAKRVKEKHLLK